jgi:hypothetical protein
MPGRFDLDTATVGQLLDDPEAKAIIDDAIPGVTTNPMVSMARGMSVASVLQMAGGRADATTVARLRERLEALS